MAIAWLDRIRDNHNADLGAFVPWSVAGRRLGFVHADHVALLRALAPEFTVGADGLVLAGAPAARQAALDRTTRELARRGAIRMPTGERYAVRRELHDPPDLSLERTAVPWFGVRPFGVHLNGWVRRDDGPWLWVAVRSRHKPTYPGRLDNLVAGGLPMGLGVRENLVKECGEEAGIAPDLAAQASSVSTLSYVTMDGRQLKPDTLFCFDLELPAAFVPRPVDGEAEQFLLLPAREVAAIARDSQRFKPNCSLVVLDFLLRHGVIAGELAPGEAAALAAALRAPLP